MNHRSDFSDAVWHKSTRSGNSGCVEVATLERVVGVRDSKDRQGPVLVFRFDEWNAFLAGVRDGEFDLPRRRSREQEQRQDAPEELRRFHLSRAGFGGLINH
jgi:hypothetical protein